MNVARNRGSRYKIDGIYTIDIQCYVGKKFGMLTVLSTYRTEKPVHIMASCACDCGKLSCVRLRSLQTGHTLSCGCKQGFIRHGMYLSPEYKARNLMISRCYNSKNVSYKSYGGRNITVCDRWLESFENFYSDMGEKPQPKNLYSLDRIDNDGNYEPGNCRWATIEQQILNRRKEIRVLKGRVILCGYCGNEKYFNPSRIKEINFCSRSCASKFRFKQLMEKI